IPAQEELAYILQSETVQILDSPEWRIEVGVIGWIEGTIQHLRHPTIGRSVDKLGAPIFDKVTLGIKLLLIEAIEQKAHPIRLQPEHFFQLVGRHRLVKIGRAS